MFGPLVYHSRNKKKTTACRKPEYSVNNRRSTEGHFELGNLLKTGEKGRLCGASAISRWLVGKILFGKTLFTTCANFMLIRPCIIAPFEFNAAYSTGRRNPFYKFTFPAASDSLSLRVSGRDLR